VPLASLELRNFWLFDKIRLDFDPRVNVFVGPNNSGKTTVLLALAAGAGMSALFPGKFAKPEALAKVEWYDRSPSVKQVYTYTSHGLQSPHVDPATPADRTWTMYVPALRLSTGYRSRGPGRMAGQEEEDIWPETGESWTSDRRIIERIIELDYRSHLKRRPAIRKTLDRIADLAGRITEGFPIEFTGVDSDGRGFFPRFRTPDGEVPLNVLSQGTQSILQWCAQLLIGYSEFYDFPESLDDKPGVLIIDEIDAHLHPSWQRRILPALTKMFPSLQIFCAAHSPMTLAGLRAGQVQLLKRDEKGRVTVSRNETDILGWSVDEIYSGFMGVEPTDLETAEKLKRLRALRHKSPKLTPEETANLNALRADIGRDLAGGPSAANVGTGAAELVRRAREAKTRSSAFR
jgi:hypothetical protein